MNRHFVLAFGVASYLMFVLVFLYAIGFVGGFWMPTSLDSTATMTWPAALGIDTFLLLVFALQHSVMARPGFKSIWMRYVPAPIERSVYVLLTNLSLGLLFWMWQPIEGIVWDVQTPAIRAGLWTLFAIGWFTVLVTTFLINHFDLFGLRQTWLYFRGQPYAQLPFVTPGPYRIVRHPLYIGWFMSFWCTPTMSVSHLVFAIGTTVYILIAIRFEERDLVKYFGERYEQYRRQVAMLIPRISR